MIACGPAFRQSDAHQPYILLPLPAAVRVQVTERILQRLGMAGQLVPGIRGLSQFGIDERRALRPFAQSLGAAAALLGV